MNITFNELVLRNFKSHKAITIVFNPITRIYGTNGAGKSSIGEAITWCLYGVDTLGNTLIKALSPEPTNYDYDRVEAHVLMTVDGKEIRIGRMIENGRLLYRINDVPKSATAFKEIVESLFDKTLFLSLFNPLYFFTQKWEEQRSQLLQYVPQPTNKEVFAGLEKLHVDKLEPLLKKKSLADLEAQHKDNKNRKDKDVLFLSGQVKAIRDDYNQAPEYDENAAKLLTEEVAGFDKQLRVLELSYAESKTAQDEYNSLNSKLNVIKTKADNIKESFGRVKGQEIADTCDKCQQPLNDEAKEKTQQHIDDNLASMKTAYDALVADHKETKKRLGEIALKEFDYADIQIIQDKRRAIENKILKMVDRSALAAKLANAEAKEQEARDSHNESVLILEAIKAFKAVEASLMAEKIAGLFPTLTLELKQYNADGTDKPYFEVYQDGKPFRKLSKAESVKAGLELVDVLVKQSGIVAPMFLDNAESILRYKAPAGQLIECRVADQSLTITEV